MAPSIDFSSDFSPAAALPLTTTSSSPRTLLLAPPSTSSHESLLRDVLATHDRAVTDLQMLDRLSAGLVSLPDATYDLVLILSDADGSRTESTQLLSRDVFARVVKALKGGGKLKTQAGAFGQAASGEELREAILAGLVADGEAMVKPDSTANDAVPLRLRRKDKGAAVSNAGPAVATTTVAVNGKRNSVDMEPARPAGVGFVDLGANGATFITGDYDDDDDELIDEDTLLTEEDLKRPVNIPPECVPRVGKRRRACKDCSCGLAERLAAEDEAKRSTADAQLQTLKLGSDDLAEVDFTVQGKVGSCGNCSLGDAFRCDGCPYIGMPAFKPGEEVRLLNNEVQL